MTAVCPRGHTSQSDDYCDQCGARMDSPPASATGRPEGAAPPSGSDPAVGPPPAAPARPSRPCPTCGTLNPIGARYCEDCGFDLDTGGDPVRAPGAEAPPGTPPAPAATWEVVVQPDRDYFDRMQAEGVDFPVAAFDRHFELVGDKVTIGRRSASRGITPDIDLSSGPTDAGVSHEHALLIRQPDGGWAVVDSGSANGTYLNDSDEALPLNQITELADGDRIHVGAWTTISLRRT